MCTGLPSTVAFHRLSNEFRTTTSDGAVASTEIRMSSGDTWGIVPADGTPKVGDGKLALGLRMELDPRAEWQQIFREAWRIERDFFYVPNLHGADWNAVWRMYAPWVEHVAHRNDLNTLLDILGGELSVGHSFVFGGDFLASLGIHLGCHDLGRRRHISTVRRHESRLDGLHDHLFRQTLLIAEHADGRHE